MEIANRKEILDFYGRAENALNNLKIIAVRDRRNRESCIKMLENIREKVNAAINEIVSLMI